MTIQTALARTLAALAACDQLAAAGSVTAANECGRLAARVEVLRAILEEESGAE